MKKFLLVALAAFALSGLAIAEDKEDPKVADKAGPALVMKKAGFTAEEIKTVLGLVEASEKAIKLALADAKLIEAQVTRLLVEDSPDLKAIETELRKAAELQVRVRLARIKLDLDIRKAVGEAKWAAYRKLVREKKED